MHCGRVEGYSVTLFFADKRVIIGGSIGVVAGVIILVLLLFVWRRMGKYSGEDTKAFVNTY